MSPIHVFDVDQTITRHSTAVRFLMEGVRLGVLPAGPLLSVPTFLLRYRAGRLTASHLRREIPALRGKSRLDLERVAREGFERRVRSDVFEGAEELVRGLIASGSEVILATLSLDIAVRPLAEWFGVKEVISSSFEFEDGRCTGRFSVGPVFNQEKCELVLRLLDSRGVAPETCSFYTDSINDLPLLERVGFPKAVNPDRRLEREAVRRGWEILRFR